MMNDYRDDTTDAGAKPARLAALERLSALETAWATKEQAKAKAQQADAAWHALVRAETDPGVALIVLWRTVLAKAAALWPRRS